MSEPLTLVISNSPSHVLCYLCFQLGFFLGKSAARDALLGLGWKPYSLMQSQLNSKRWFGKHGTSVMTKYVTLGIQSVAFSYMGFFSASLKVLRANYGRII